jgi:hypothetical protein
MEEQLYKGRELELFEKAVNWKKYFGQSIRPYLHGKILEAGAGIGGTTKILCNGKQESWLCLEPDPDLFAALCEKIKNKQLPAICSARQETLSDLAVNDHFHSILYIDVIEHIGNDKMEMMKASEHLLPGGYLIVLAPAYQSLFTVFDSAIGHFRRYNKQTLKEIIPAGLRLVSLKYFDSAGLMASVINKLLLKQEYPTQRQIQLWDKVMIPVSKVADVLTGHRVGKSLLGIWEREA